MSTSFVNWCRPMRPGVVVAVAALAFVSVLISTASAYGWAPPLWVRMSLAPREGSGPAGIVTAVLAAWVASEVTPGRITGGLGRARTGLPTTFRHLSRLVVAAFTGTTVGLVPALAVTGARATAGRPDVLALADGYLVIAFWIVLGYFVGTIVPRGWSLFAAAVAAAFVWVLPQALRQFALFSVFPVWSLDWPYLGDTLIWLTEVFRIVFFTGVIGALALAGSRWAGRTTGALLVDSGRTALVLVPVTLLAGLAVVQQPLLVAGEPDPPVSCHTSPLVKVCLHQGFEKLVPVAGRAADDVVRAAGAPGPVIVVEDSASLRYPEADAIIRTTQDSATAVGAQWASEVAYLLVGAAQCQTQRGSSEDVTQRMLVAETIADELTTRAGYTFRSRVATSSGTAWVDLVLAERLGGMRDVEFARWFTENHEQIGSCALDPSAR